MLKIYLCTLDCELHTKNKKISIGKYTYYNIENECNAITKTTEFSAYSDDAMKIYNHVGVCIIHNKRKGKVVTYDYYGDVYCLKEWIEPDAKLVASLSYKEQSCSMERLMKLPATDVIAYLKQEGFNSIAQS